MFTIPSGRDFKVHWLGKGIKKRSSIVEDVLKRINFEVSFFLRSDGIARTLRSRTALAFAAASASPVNFFGFDTKVGWSDDSGLVGTCRSNHENAKAYAENI